MSEAVVEEGRPARLMGHGRAYVQDAGELQMLEYANESGVECPCGDSRFEFGGIDASGVQPGTVNGPAVYWFSGWVSCKCGRRIFISDSSD